VEEEEAITKTGSEENEKRGRAEISQLKSLALQSSAELSLRQENSDWGSCFKVTTYVPGHARGKQHTRDIRKKFTKSDMLFLKKRDHLGYIGLNGKEILKWTLNKYGVRVWIHVFRTESSCDSREYGNETLCPKKAGKHVD
jgi:hypothetical protein